MNYAEEALKLHAEHHGKIRVEGKVEVRTPEDLSLAYTPGVAQPCLEIAKDPALAYTYTAKGNLVAVVSDGSAVLGLGNIGGQASMPVMEGKSLLFKRFGNVDAFPICLDTQDTEEIIETVRRIAPVFGGINLEDIASPKCFEIEQRLEKELEIPVFHDDQHGTAIVVLAALINALKIVRKEMGEIRVVLNGPGSAGTAVIHMLMQAGVKDIIACDEHGILYPGRPEGLPGHKAALAEETNPRGIRGGLTEALEGADVFIGLSVGGCLKPEMIHRMNHDPIVFAMANPVPEIMYDEAMAAGVAVMGTGRSDMPNQINNVLAFPGVFRGALDVRARDINYAMKLAAAKAIADAIPEAELTAENIIPSLFAPGIAEIVAAAVSKAARETGVARL